MLAYWYDCHTRDPHAHREAPSRKAAERGQSKSSVVRKALEAALTRDRKPGRVPSPASRTTSPAVCRARSTSRTTLATSTRTGADAADPRRHGPARRLPQPARSPSPAGSGAAGRAARAAPDLRGGRVRDLLSRSTRPGWSERRARAPQPRRPADRLPTRGQRERGQADGPLRPRADVARRRLPRPHGRSAHGQPRSHPRPGLPAVSQARPSRHSRDHAGRPAARLTPEPAPPAVPTTSTIR